MKVILKFYFRLTPSTAWPECHLIRNLFMFYREESQETEEAVPYVLISGKSLYLWQFVYSILISCS